LGDTYVQCRALVWQLVHGICVEVR